MLMTAAVRQSLIRLFDLYTENASVKYSTVCVSLGRSGGFYRELLKGHECISAYGFDRMALWFSEHWPEGLEWPSDIPRPTRDEFQPRSRGRKGRTPTTHLERERQEIAALKSKLGLT